MDLNWTGRQVVDEAAGALNSAASYCAYYTDVLDEIADRLIDGLDEEAALLVEEMPAVSTYRRKAF